jgi:cytochrome c peroxidase
MRRWPASSRASTATGFSRPTSTPGARLDKYLKGDRGALSVDELRGYQLFKAYGCAACHQGVNVGGNMFQTFGVMGDYFKKRGNITDADLGRYNVTRHEGDRHVFKVPSLRNVALTAPYFHDGSARTLGDAVDVMFTYQLGRPASPQDKELIVKFLHTLTGEYRGRPLEPVDVLADRRP